MEENSREYDHVTCLITVRTIKNMIRVNKDIIVLDNKSQFTKDIDHRSSNLLGTLVHSTQKGELAT